MVPGVTFCPYFGVFTLCMCGLLSNHRLKGNSPLTDFWSSLHLAPSCLVLCPTNCSQFCLLKLISICSIQWDYHALLGIPPAVPQAESVSRQKYRQLSGSLHLFPFSHGSQSCTACCPMLGNCYFIYFAQFLIIYSGRISPIPIPPEAEVVISQF